MLSALIAIAPLFLTASLFIETSSWWIRAQAPSGSVGLYVSRSNIYLYGGRFFALGFTSLAAYWIESGAQPSQIAFLIGWSLLGAATVQLALLQHAGSSHFVIKVLTALLGLPPPQRANAKKVRAVSVRLLSSTIFASAIFGVGLGLPLVAAVLIPEYRLSVSYLGQIVNSIGTLIVLFMVDQLLFRALDAGTLPEDVRDYGTGRFAGLFIAGMVFLISGYALSDG